MLHMNIQRNERSIKIILNVLNKPACLRVGPVEIKTDNGWKIKYQIDEETKLYIHSKEIYFGKNCDGVTFEDTINNSYDMDDIIDGLEDAVNKWNSMIYEKSSW